MNSASSILHRNLHPASRSPLQSEVDALVGGFSAQATDWRSLSALVAAGSAYRIGRLGISSLGAGFRTASVGAGLAAEVSMFELTHRSLQSGHPNLWRWSGSGGIRQGLLQSFITFGALKGAGHWGRGENVVLQHLMQDSAMVAGHQASGLLGITPTPTGSLAEQFLHAEVTVLQLGAGLSLVHGLAPGLHGLSQGLDLSFRGSEIPPASSLPRRAGENFALSHAGGRPLAAGEVVGSWAMMSSILKGPKGRRGPSDLPVGASSAATNRREPGITEPPPAMGLIQWIRNGLPESETEASLPQEELERLSQLPQASLVPRDPKAQALLVSQMKLGALPTLRERFERLVRVLTDPKEMGESYYGSVSNGYAAVSMNLYYLREELPGATTASLIGGRRVELPPHLEEARRDIFNGLKKMAPFFQALQWSKDGAFLQTAYFGKPTSLCSMEGSYRHLFREVLPALTVKQRQELGYENFSDPSNLKRRIRRLAGE